MSGCKFQDLKLVIDIPEGQILFDKYSSLSVNVLMELEVLGVHHIAELCECNALLLNNSEFISTSLRQAIKYANATLIEEIKYEFTPQGITAVCLLAESHISIHTWPEKHYAAVDIFTCGDHTMPDKACQYMVDVLECKQPKMTVLKRGI